MHEQGTAEWLSERAGKVTASKIADVMAVSKSTGKPLATRDNYKADLICERLTGEPKQAFVNDAMRWGTETEPQARAMYAFNEGMEVVETGFVPHPSIAMSGASPDGLSGDDGLVEIKCPNSATHIETLKGAKIDRKYLLQMQWQMACTGRKWCDFVSFDPRLSPAKQYLCQRVERDDELIAEMEAAVADFLTEIEADLAELETKYPEQKKAA